MANECRILDPNGHTQGLSDLFQQLEGLVGAHGELEDVKVKKGRIRIRWIHVDDASWCLAVIEPGTEFEGFHNHPGQKETLFGIIGYAELALQGRKLILGPGDSTTIPEGVNHTVTRYWSDDGSDIIEVGRLFPRTGFGINGYGE